MALADCRAHLNKAGRVLDVAIDTSEQADAESAQLARYDIERLMICASEAHEMELKKARVLRLLHSDRSELHDLGRLEMKAHTV